MNQTFFVRAAFFTSVAGVCYPALAQIEQASSAKSAQVAWVLHAEAEEVSLGDGLPVLALDRDDWPNYLSNHGGTARAMRSLRAELTATHPTGWRLATLARSEAWIEASEDAVTAAALEVNHLDPVAPSRFKVAASSQSWQGLGLKIGTPWWSIGDSGLWRWQADAQVLKLRRLRTADISGDISYVGGGAYDVHLSSRRSNADISGLSLPASGQDGLGASLSFALQGEPMPGMRVQLRADDLFSRLQWASLATDTSVLNSQVTSRNPDGSLDYAALLKGGKSLIALDKRIGTHWYAKVSWDLSGLGRVPGAMTLRAERQAGMSQYWLGWDSSVTEKAQMRWLVELEPYRNAMSAGVSWGHWRAVLATDGKGTGTENRRVSVGWRVEL